MANPQTVTTNDTSAPQVWASPGDPDAFNNGVGQDSRLSGPQYLSTIKTKNNRRYCLDLSGKYNKDSQLKQFHCATFVFRGAGEENANKQNEGAILTMALPNKIKYSFGGKWQSQFSGLGGSGESFIGGMAAALSGGAFNGTFDISTASAWVGGQELSMILSFPVFDDVGDGSGVNYQEALALLGEATLPSINEYGAYHMLPGPTIWQTMEKGGNIAAQKVSDYIRGSWMDTAFEYVKNAAGLKVNPWQRITLQLGGLLLIDWCIIKRVSVEFPNTKHQVLHSWENIQDDPRKMHLQPLLANIEVEISTVQNLTVDNFKNMLQLSEGDKAKDWTKQQQQKATSERNEAANKIVNSLNEARKPYMDDAYPEAKNIAAALQSSNTGTNASEIGGVSNSMKIKGPVGAMTQYYKSQGMD